MKRLLKKKLIVAVAAIALVLLVAGIAIPVLADSGNSNAANSGETANGNNFYGDCYDYMTANGYGPGTGWEGYMGPGMMYGWGAGNSSPETTPVPGTGSGNSNAAPGGLQNGGYGGWGMMGGW